MNTTQARFGGTELDEEHERDLHKARRLEIITLVYLSITVVLVFAVMGNSQAMKVAWIEDCLSMLPPLAFLVAVRLSRRKPDEEYPYGHHRSIGAAHLTSAVALLALGGFMVVDSALTLVRAEHPTIGTFNVLGQQVWQGWVMISALIATAIPAVILGRLKLPLSESLHDKVLYADADMNKADWVTATGGCLGILGIGVGLWWADAAVALLIAATIVKDGLENIRNAVAGLLDRRAQTHDDSGPHPVIAQVADYFDELPWVREFQIRMRDLGHVMHTEVFVVPQLPNVSVDDVEAARKQASEIDWKLNDLVVIPVPNLGYPEGSE